MSIDELAIQFLFGVIVAVILVAASVARDRALKDLVASHRELERVEARHAFLVKEVELLKGRREEDMRWFQDQVEALERESKRFTARARLLREDLLRAEQFAAAWKSSAKMRKARCAQLTVALGDVRRAVGLVEDEA